MEPIVSCRFQIATYILPRCQLQTLPRICSTSTRLPSRAARNPPPEIKKTPAVRFPRKENELLLSRQRRRRLRILLFANDGLRETKTPCLRWPMALSGLHDLATVPPS